MSKVILINRPLINVKGFHVPRRKWPPLNLLYIATSLNNKKIKTEIIDARAMDYTSEDVELLLKEKKPEIVLIASDPFDFYQCPNPSLDSFYEMIKIANQVGSNYILSIGPQATIFDKEFLQNKAINYIIKGDDPITSVQLIEDLLNNKKGIDYKNLSYKRDGKIKLGTIHNLENLNELPIPNYQLLPMNKYSPNMKVFPEGKFSLVSTSRGCPFSCKFCLKVMMGHKMRKMSLPNVEQELDKLVFKEETKNIYFIDDFFTFNHQRIFDLCQLILNKKYNIWWGCQTRTDSVSKELLTAMKKAGCGYISYGVEGGSQRILDHCNKQLNLDEVKKTLKMTQNSGIAYHTNILYGFPSETVKDFNQGIDFLRKFDKESFPGAIRFFPGCPYYKELLPGKSLKEAIDISLGLGLSRLKYKDVDRGLAKLVLSEKLANKEYNLKLVYFVLKYLFPGLLGKIKKFKR